MFIRFFKSLYLHRRFFYVLFALAFLFLASFWWHRFYVWAWLLVFLTALIFLTDLMALYTASRVEGERNLPEKFSNGDANLVTLRIFNHYAFSITVEVIDEIPLQFQKRDFLKTLKIAAREDTEYSYNLLPKERGIYVFGKLNIYVSTTLGFVKRRYSFQNKQEVKVYPSFVQMKKYDFLAIDQRHTSPGLKKIRRIGHTMEFEQIKDYVRGDDVRTINWKATAKHGELMVNQYQDEKSQPIYTVINTGRVMKMPFEELSLLDYAINSALAFSNIALKKNDKIGLLTYANTIQQFLPASGKKTQLTQILEALYKIDTAFLDTDIGLLYGHLKRKLNRRSLLLLYTNFEHEGALSRQLPYLMAIAKKHLLVVIFFENTELQSLIDKKAEELSEIYDQTIAREFSHDKLRMMKRLQKNGIHTILTAPKSLTIDTINKYLELKSRGLF